MSKAKKPVFSESDDYFLKQNFLLLPLTELAEKLGKGFTPENVQERITELKLSTKKRDAGFATNKYGMVSMTEKAASVKADRNGSEAAFRKNFAKDIGKNYEE